MDYEQSSGPEWGLSFSKKTNAVKSPSPQISTDNEKQTDVSLVGRKPGSGKPDKKASMEDKDAVVMLQHKFNQKRVQTKVTAATHSNAASRYLSARTRYMAGALPADQYELSGYYGKYNTQLITDVGRSFLNLKPGSHDLDIFIQISRSTGTFVKKPSDNEQTILLWGSPQHVLSAKSLLSGLFERYNAAAIRKNQDWGKVRVNKGNIESDVPLQKETESLIYMLRRPPNPGSGVSNRMVFLWPDNEISIREVLGAELQGLDFLRSRYKCYIYSSEENANVICMASSDQESLQLAIKELETKWFELIASSTLMRKIYLLNLPDDEPRVKAITIVKNKGLAKPRFVMNPSNEVQREEPSLWGDESPVENNARLLSVVKRSLCCVPLIKGVPSMRVSLGSFIFEWCREPKNRDVGYSVEEFEEMISDERTKGRLLPGIEINQKLFCNRVFQAEWLLQLTDSQASPFSGKSLEHTVIVEFDAINNDFLRLEIEFKTVVGIRHERTKSRWIEIQTKGKRVEEQPLLQAIMLDAQNADWQVEIKETKVLGPYQISPAMDEFDHQVRLRDGIIQESLMTTKPKRRTILPDGFPVCRLVEKAAAQYRVKGTDYILEIARYDTYSKSFKQSGKATNSQVHFGPPSSSWGVTLFGENWDQDMAKLAETKGIQEMGFYSILDPFFSQKTEDGNKAGFRGFINVVEDVARLLGKSE